MKTRPRDRPDFVRDPLIPDRPPPPEVAAEVRRILEQDPTQHINPPRPPEPTMADALPDGMSDADPPPEPRPLPQPPVPRETRPSDETTAVVVQFSRFAQADLANFGWLLQRLGEHYRHIHTTTWAGRLRMYMGDNGHFFIRSKHAVLLATMARDPMGTEPYVLPIWCFHTQAEFGKGTAAGGQGTVGELETVALLREAARWGGRAGAREMRCGTMICDIPAARLEGLLGAEKREELVLKINPMRAA